MFAGKVTHSSPTGVYRGVGSNPSFLRVKRKRGVAMKKLGKMKVSREFKKKVRVAMDDNVSGRYLKVQYAHFPPSGTLNTQQTPNFGAFFTPTYYANASSILFNGNTAGAVEFPAITDVNWNDPISRKDHILNSYVSFEMKNMSQRTYTVKMYVCAPKTKIDSNDAYGDWQRGLESMNNYGTNPLNNTPQTLYADPRHVPQFNNLWKTEVTTCVLTPGETNTFFVQGPSDYTIDYTKMWQKNSSLLQLPYPWAKFSRHIFFVYYPDILTTTLATPGRYPSTGTGGGGLAIEYKQLFKISCPVTAGFVYPASTAAGVNQSLDRIEPVKVIKIFSIAQSGTTQDVNEENPVSVFDPVD